MTPSDHVPELRGVQVHVERSIALPGHAKVLSTRNYSNNSLFVVDIGIEWPA